MTPWIQMNLKVADENLLTLTSRKSDLDTLMKLNVGWKFHSSLTSLRSRPEDSHRPLSSSFEFMGPRESFIHFSKISYEFTWKHVACPALYIKIFKRAFLPCSAARSSSSRNTFSAFGGLGLSEFVIRANKHAYGWYSGSSRVSIGIHERPSALPFAFLILYFISKSNSNRRIAWVYQNSISRSHSSDCWSVSFVNLDHISLFYRLHKTTCCLCFFLVCHTTYDLYTITFGSPSIHLKYRFERWKVSWSLGVSTQGLMLV